MSLLARRLGFTTAAFEGGGGGGSGIADPTELTGNILWLKADSFTGLSDGDRSGTWIDQSGTGNDVGNSTVSQQPIYKTNILNGMPVLRGTGGERLVNGSATVPGADDWMMWGVWSNRATGTNEEGYMGVGDNSNGYGAHASTNTGKKGALFDNVAWLSSAVAEATGFEVWVLQRRSGTTRLWVNGGSPIVTSTATPNTPANDIFVFASSGSRLVADVDIAECGLHDGASALSDADSIGDYLADRWGLTWSTPSDS